MARPSTVLLEQSNIKIFKLNYFKNFPSPLSHTNTPIIKSSIFNTKKTPPNSIERLTYQKVSDCHEKQNTSIFFSYPYGGKSMSVCLHGECHAAATVIDLYKIMYSNFIFSQRDVNVQPKK